MKIAAQNLEKFEVVCRSHLSSLGRKFNADLICEGAAAGAGYFSEVPLEQLTTLLDDGDFVVQYWAGEAPSEGFYCGTEPNKNHGHFLTYECQQPD